MQDACSVVKFEIWNANYILERQETFVISLSYTVPCNIIISVSTDNLVTLWNTTLTFMEHPVLVFLITEKSKLLASWLLRTVSDKRIPSHETNSSWHRLTPSQPAPTQHQHLKKFSTNTRFERTDILTQQFGLHEKLTWKIRMFIANYPQNKWTETSGSQ